MTNNTKHKILLVDDVVENIKMIISLFRHEYRIIFSQNEEFVSEIAKMQKPDLILLNISIPDGYELCQELKSHSEICNIPVILISPLNEITDKAKGFEMGAVDYITTPFQASEVMARVNTHLAFGRLKNDLERQVKYRTSELEITNIKLKAEIKEREQVESVLNESEMLARTLLDAPVDFAVLTDTRGKIIDINQRAAGIIQQSRTRLIGKIIWDLLPEMMIKNREPHVRNVVQSGKPIRFIDEFQGLWYDNVAYPITNSRKDITKIAFLSSDITARRPETDETKTKKTVLEEVNMAMKVVLENKDDVNLKLQENIVTNIKQTVLPYLEKLKQEELNERQKSYIKIMESNLYNILSPFARKLSSSFIRLTSTEIKVADLIKSGKSSKGIADTLGLSPQTIDFHRKNIRKKLGLKNRKKNLRTYLLSIR